MKLPGHLHPPSSGFPAATIASMSSEVMSYLTSAILRFSASLGATTAAAAAANDDDDDDDDDVVDDDDDADDAAAEADDADDENDEEAEEMTVGIAGSDSGKGKVSHASWSSSSHVFFFVAVAPCLAASSSSFFFSACCCSFFEGSATAVANMLNDLSVSGAVVLNTDLAEKRYKRREKRPAQALYVTKRV